MFWCLFVCFPHLSFLELAGYDERPTQSTAAWLPQCLSTQATRTIAVSTPLPIFGLRVPRALSK